MRKGLIGILLAAVLSVQVSAAPVFSDVPENKWFAQAISFCKERSFVSGYSDGSFKPGNQITRAEFCVMLDKLAENARVKKETIVDNESCVPYQRKYRDYSINRWYSIPVANCIANGYISGMSDDYLGMNEKILRQDVAVMMDKMYGWTFDPVFHQGGMCVGENYHDSDGDSHLRYWFKSMYRFIDLGIYQGDAGWQYESPTVGNESKYQNNRPITRAEMCAVIQYIYTHKNWIEARENKYVKKDAYGSYFYSLKDDEQYYQQWEDAMSDPGYVMGHKKRCEPETIDGITILVMNFEDYRKGDMVEVPDLTGLTKEEAIQKAEEAGLVIPEENIGTGTLKDPDDRVTGHSPIAGAKVPEGSEMWIY